MLAKVADEVPRDGDFLFEPKWDGFRAIVFRSKDEVYIQSRDLRPLDRYFPDLHAVFLEQLPSGAVVDGEIVMPTKHGLDFGGLQMRLHPAASRVEKLARATPAAFVAFDLLAVDGKSLLDVPQGERRVQLEKLFKKIRRPLYLTPMTRDRERAVDWLKRFEGAGLDGVIAKPASATYQPGKRAMFKIKHVRSADCVVAGFRWHKSGKDTLGSLLLGLYDDEGTLQHVGVTSAFPMVMRKQLVKELTPLRKDALQRLRSSGDFGGSPVRSGASSSTSWRRISIVNDDVMPTWCSSPASSYSPSSSEPTASCLSRYQRKPVTTQSAVRECLILNIARLPGW